MSYSYLMSLCTKFQGSTLEIEKLANKPYWMNFNPTSAKQGVKLTADLVKISRTDLICLYPKFQDLRFKGAKDYVFTKAILA